MRSENSNGLLAVLIVLLGGLGWSWMNLQRQNSEVSRLRSALSALRGDLKPQQELTGQLERARSENKSLSGKVPDVVELADLRGKAGELTRAQKENARLRSELEQVRKASARQRGVVQFNEATGETPHKVATELIITSGQTAILGGWDFQGGKRGFALVTPVLTAEGDVLVESKIVSVREGDARQTALGGLLGERNAGAAIVDDPSLRKLLDALQQGSGLETISSPRVQTRSGMEAKVSVMDGSNTGIEVSVTPRVGADGRSINMKLSVQVSLPK